VDAVADIVFAFDPAIDRPLPRLEATPTAVAEPIATAATDALLSAAAAARQAEAAALVLFGRVLDPQRSSPAQAAMLAGLLKAPSKYAPTNNLKRAQDRAAVIIDLMLEQGYLTTAEAQEAKANPAQLSAAAAQSSGGFFADWVMESAPAFLTSETTEDVIIDTTLDPAMQAKAEEALAWVFENKIKDGSKAQAAIVVMSADGAVRAMVGGRKTQDAGAFNRATQAMRQPGSSFKPFVYATALDNGYTPSSIVLDEPIEVDQGNGEIWRPENYDGRPTGAPILALAGRYLLR
jgi:penicillin-binding protein 1A